VSQQAQAGCQVDKQDAGSAMIVHTTYLKKCTFRPVFIAKVAEWLLYGVVALRLQTNTSTPIADTYCNF